MCRGKLNRNDWLTHSVTYTVRNLPDTLSLRLGPVSWVVGCLCVACLSVCCLPLCVLPACLCPACLSVSCLPVLPACVACACLCAVCSVEQQCVALSRITLGTQLSPWLWEADRMSLGEGELCLSTILQHARTHTQAAAAGSLQQTRAYYTWMCEKLIWRA